MGRRYSRVLVLVCTILLTIHLVSCKKDDQAATFTSREIFGTWKWVQSVGGIAGRTYTPANSGYTQSLQFNRDSTYVVRRNNGVLDSGRFTIKEEKTMYGDQPLPVLYFKDGQLGETILQLTPDSLGLAQNCYDCFGSEYVRVSDSPPVSDQSH